MPTPHDPGLRAADADRERVAGELRRHFTEGRLNQEELDERVDAVYAAKTLGGLDAPLRDLPRSGKPAPPAEREARHLIPAASVPMLLVVLAVAGAVGAAVAGAPWVLWAVGGWLLFAGPLGKRGSHGFGCHGRRRHRRARTASL